MLHILGRKKFLLYMYIKSRAHLVNHNQGRYFPYFKHWLALFLNNGLGGLQCLSIQAE